MEDSFMYMTAAAAAVIVDSIKEMHGDGSGC